MTTIPVCWKCAAALADLLLPLARLAQCQACHADLHVCRSCVYYDTRVANQCREPVAEPVSDKTRANFCGYFQFRADACQPQAAAQDQATAVRAALDQLFAGKPEQ